MKNYKALGLGNGLSFALGALLLLCLGAPAQAGHSITRTSSFDYEPGTGVLVKEVVEPEKTNLCVVTQYGLDPVSGQRTSTTTRNCNGSTPAFPGAITEAVAPVSNSAALFTTRQSTSTYTADKRFVATSTNALGHAETLDFDPRFGGMTSQTGPNGLQTQWAYDNFGRKVLERRADGNGTKIAYQPCSTYVDGGLACPVLTGDVKPAYAVTTTPVAGPIDMAARTTGPANGTYQRVYYDPVSRPLRIVTRNFDDTADIYQDFDYEGQRGVLKKKTRPYAADTTPYWIYYTYDALGRELTQSDPTDDAPTGATVTTAYSGLVTTVTDPLGNVTTTTRDVSGQIVSVTDAKNGTLTFTRDALGNPVQTADAVGNVTSATFDTRGRRTALYDPDLGTWSYQYNALGELTRQTDAKGQVTVHTYDVLGRLVKRAEPSLTTDWYYDRYAADSAGSTCAKGVGKLCEQVSGNTHSRRITYDSLGRTSSVTSNVGGAYTVQYGYDDHGRLKSTVYPTGLAVSYVYNGLGHLKQVIDARNSAALWTANAVDVEGRVTVSTLGNGVVQTDTYNPGTGRLKSRQAGPGNLVSNLAYQYDLMGSVLKRQDMVTGVSSSYEYDELNRLKTEVRTGGSIAGTQVNAWTYDAIGNIRTRQEGSRTSTYNYNSSGAGSLRPHAVANVSGYVSGLAVPRYQYDANGNMVSGAGRAVTWHSFNKVETISSGITQLAYQYDGDGDRVQERLYRNGALKRTTVYLHPAGGSGLLYEEENGVNGLKRKHFISAGGSVIGVITCGKDDCTAVANTTTQYWHKDALGSVVAITNASGVVIERLAYESFGKRAYSNGLLDNGDTVTGLNGDRGFTGHEHIDAVGLINMNGRIFDPGLARFMSADPFVQSPYNLQSYNRYSYCLGGPLSCTDPSGYFSLKKLVRTVVAAVVTYYTGGLAGAYFNSAIIGGAVGGFSGGLVASKGNVNAALKSALVGAAAGWAGGFEANPVQHYAAHAAVGCFSAEINGGQCGKGAIAQMASLAVTGATASEFKNNTVAHFAAATVAGGVASKIMGGSFANGAQTAAFGYLFNFCAHDPRCLMRQAGEEFIGAVTRFANTVSDFAGRLMTPRDIIVDGINYGPPSTGTVPLPLVGVGGAATEVAYAARLTKGSATQLNVNMTQATAIENLAANGYSRALSKDGTVTIMSQGDKTYRFYPGSTGGGVAGAPSGVPSASVSIGNKIVTKLRFVGAD